jgi:hypothetical protein
LGRIDAGTVSEPDVFAGRLAALLELSAGIFPYPVVGTGDQGEWLVTGPAFVARAARSLEALSVLRADRFDCDAYVILRSLYEHLLRFSWLAIDPGKHMPLWIKWDRKHRLEVDRVMRAANDPLTIPEQATERFKREIASVRGEMPKLERMAEQVDTHWSKVSQLHSGPDERYGFSGMHRVVFRHCSAVAHGSAIGLKAVIGSGVVGRETPGLDDPFAMATVIYSMGLLVFADAFFIPGVLEALDAIFAAFPDPR